jgi:methionyl-tRNA synthetase
MSKTRKLLVTSALPYANGPLHMGHMVEYIQTDIWVRFQKLIGNSCYYVCADDAHGTAISLHAEQQGITAEESIQQINKQRKQDFNEFMVEFDLYSSTHSEANKQLTTEIYNKLQTKNCLTVKTISQAYDTEKQMFLADRYIKGDCPKCGAQHQYGDNCESCGATYQASELKNAYSSLSGTAPVTKDTEHVFFKLSEATELLTAWLTTDAVPKEVRQKLFEWVNAGLKDWDICRDAPYFGFEIPDMPNKYFYVWLDAPIGYMSTFKTLCEQQQLDFNEYWQPNSSCEVHHFIGKDIINFHCLFWPSILTNCGFRTPTAVHVHGYLTINGEKMSKSRGTFISARNYLDHLQPEYLRYYYATKLSTSIDDLDFNTEDFAQKINSDLVGKFVNIASRCAGFITKKFDGKLATALPETMQQFYQQFPQAAETIANFYEAADFAKAMRAILALADTANSWINDAKPWVIAKDPNNDMQLLQQICTVGINIFRVLAIYLKPVLPQLAVNVEQFLNVSAFNWEDSQELLLNHTINKFKPLMQRIEPEKITAVLDASATPIVAAKEVSKPTIEPIAATIDINDFAKVDLRIGKIIEAKNVEKAAKLLQLTIDIGEEKPRNIFAGLKSAYTAEQLQGRYTVVVANLAPRKMRFGISEGMVLAAGTGGKDLWVLEPDAGVQPGMKVS